jgi:hypothetical protein
VSALQLAVFISSCRSRHIKISKAAASLESIPSSGLSEIGAAALAPLVTSA